MHQHKSFLATFKLILKVFRYHIHFLAVLPSRLIRVSANAQADVLYMRKMCPKRQSPVAIATISPRLDLPDFDTPFFGETLVAHQFAATHRRSRRDTLV